MDLCNDDDLGLDDAEYFKEFLKFKKNRALMKAMDAELASFVVGKEAVGTSEAGSNPPPPGISPESSINSPPAPYIPEQVITKAGENGSKRQPQDGGAPQPEAYNINLISDNEVTDCVTAMFIAASPASEPMEVQTDGLTSTKPAGAQTDTSPVTGKPEKTPASSAISELGPDEGEALLAGSNDPEARQIQSLALKGTRLKKAQRKRYKWLREHGHSHEEASVLCLKTVAEREGRDSAPAMKRGRSDTSVPGEKPVAKKPKPEALSEQAGAKLQGMPYSKALGGVKTGIIPADYPQIALTVEQQTELENRLARLILLCTEDESPKFSGTIFRPGYIVINCTDQATAEWVKTKEKYLQLPDLKVSVVGEKEIPSPHVVTGYFPNSQHYAGEEVKKMIKVQNGLQTDLWNTIRVADTGKNCVEIQFSVDHASFIALEKSDFQISYRLGSIKLHAKRERPADTKTARHAIAQLKAKLPAKASSSQRPTSNAREITTQKKVERHPQASSSNGRSGNTGRPFLRQERVNPVLERNMGKPWKYQHSKPRNERH